MPSEAMKGEIEGRDEEGKGSESERGGEINAVEVNETVEAMMASKSGDEGEYVSNNTIDNADTGEGSKRKNEAVTSTPDRQTGDNSDGRLNDPAQESERARGPDSKRKKKDIADFFERINEAKEPFRWDPTKDGAGEKESDKADKSNKRTSLNKRPRLPTPPLVEKGTTKQVKKRKHLETTE